MDEILKKLLDENILTEDTQKELKLVIESQIKEAVEVAKKAAEAEVRTQLAEQFITERDALIEAVDVKISDFLKDELSEFKGDIEQYRDLKAEYAQKVVEAKEEMAAQLKTDLAQLVEKMDRFIEIRLTSEIDELREDIEEQKKNQFGRTVFEAFQKEFKNHYAGRDTTEGLLRETEQRLDDALTALEKIEEEKNKLLREKKMGDVLAPLSGRQKEVMEAILQGVDTGMLEEAYKTYLPRILKETVVQESKAPTSEKEDKVLAEGDKKVVPQGVVKTGDNEELKEAQEKDTTSSTVITEGERAKLRKLAGLV